MKSKQMLFAVIVVLGLAGIAQAWTFRPATLKANPVIGGTYDPAGMTPRITYPGFTASPGESLDFTFYDFQANGSVSRMIEMDLVGNGGLHVVYTKSPNSTHTPRNAVYQFNDRAGGGWTGELDVSTARGGFPTLATLTDGRVVIAFHQGGGGTQSYIATDAARGVGGFIVTPLDTGPLWPHVGIGPTTVFHVVAHHATRAENYYCRSTNQGASFTPWAPITGDTMQNPISADVITSRMSGKVAMAWTRMRPGGTHVQIDMDVVFKESTDNGATWGTRVNVTNYQTSDTVRAYNDVSGVYDQSDNLHLVWAGRRVIGGTTFYEDAAVFHWRQGGPGIQVVSGAGHNLPGTSWWSLPGLPGTWSMDVTRPSLSGDASGKLYCVWSGQVQPNDTSAEGYVNMDLYGRGSVDNGSTWGAFRRTDTMIYITNSHTPGGLSGACDDDRFPSITKVTTDSVRTLFVEDKDAGSSLKGEGATVSCPVKYLTVKADWFWPSTGVETAGGKSDGGTIRPLTVQPNPFVSFATVPGREGEIFELYDISGRRIGTYRGDRIGHNLGPGVYFLKLEHGHAKPFRIVKVK